MGRLSRDNVELLILRGERLNLSGENLRDLDLAELNLRRADFSGADVRGARFYNPEHRKVQTNLRETGWADVNFPDQWNGVSFEWADLTQAVFESTGSVLLNLSTVNFDHATLDGTRWQRVFFGEMDYYNPTFVGATLREACVRECNLAGLDLSEADDIFGIQIIDPVYLTGMRIREDQAAEILRGFQITQQDNDVLRSINAVLELGRTNAETASEICGKLGINVIP